MLCQILFSFFVAFLKNLSISTVTLLFPLLLSRNMFHQSSPILVIIISACVIVWRYLVISAWSCKLISLISCSRKRVTVSICSDLHRLFFLVRNHTRNHHVLSHWSGSAARYFLSFSAAISCSQIFSSTHADWYNQPRFPPVIYPLLPLCRCVVNLHTTSHLRERCALRRTREANVSCH